MATRTISTRVAITGEDGYRASLSRINTELKSLQAQLRLSQAQFQNNANSIDALTAKDTALNNIKVAQTAKVEKLQKALENAQKAEAKWAETKEELTQKLKRNEEALKELGERTEENADEFDRLTKENDELNAALKNSNACYEAASRGALNYQAKLTAAETALAKTNADLELNAKYLEEARNSADNCATSIDQFGNRVKVAADKSDQLYDALATAGLISALKEVAEQLKACVDASIEFESAMAGVKKTTDMSEEELNDMADAIQEMATRIPATTTEIAGVVEAAGQLGIAKEDLLDFTEVMINLGVATNLTSEEAATSLAKMANITGTPAEAYSRLGSTVVDLGNNFATTESDIVAMATRLAAAGTLAGLTEHEILALATAMSSVGIEAEAGGTAMTQTLNAIETAVVGGGEELNKFAAVAEMTANDFAYTWNTNPVQAVYAFMNGIGNLESKGESATLVLEDLELTGIRQANMIKSLGNASGVLLNAVDKANVAWKEDIALNVEASTRYATTESRMQMLSNSANNLKIAIGDELAPAFGQLVDSGADVLEWATEFVEEHEMLVPVLTATAATLGVLTTAVVGYTVAAKAASAISKMLSAAMSANPYLIAATAVAALVAGIGTLVIATEDEIESTKELSAAAHDAEKSLSDIAKTTEDTKTTAKAAAEVAFDYIDRLKELEAAGLNTAEQQKEYHNILVLLSETIPELARYIDLETDSIWGGTDALLANTNAWRDNALMQAHQEQLSQIAAKYADVLYEQAENEIKLAQAQEQRRAKTEEQAAVADRMNQLMARASEEAARQHEEYGALVDASDLLTQEYYDLEAEYIALGDEISEFERQENNLTKAIDNDREAVAAAEEEMATAQEVVDYFTGKVEDNTDAVEANAEAQEAAAASSSLLKTKASELADSYKEVRNEVGITMGLFSDFKVELDEDLNSVDEMTAAWNSQAKQIKEYTENLQTALEYAEEFGLSENLIKEFSDGSAESAAQLDVIITKIQNVISDGGNAQKVIDELNSSYEGAQQAQSDFADLVAYWQSDFSAAVTEMAAVAEGADYTEIKNALETAFAELELDLTPAWETFTAAMAEGTGSVQESTKEAISEAVEDGVAAAGETVGESAENIGAGIITGLTSGVEDGKDAVTESVEEVAKTLNEAMTNASIEAIEAFMVEFVKISTRTSETLTSLRASVTEIGAGLKSDMTTVGREMINGMIAGLNDRESSLYARIRSIVNTSIEAAKEAAAVHSPSDKTTYIFEQVGEGMIVGAENKREKVKETLQSVVDEALRLDISGTATIEAAISRTNNPASQMEAALSQMASVAKKTASGGVTNNFYPKSMSKSEMDYFVRKIIREMGSMV